MNSRLSSWSQIAEIAGAIAVVLSLVYVGYEIRQNTVSTEAEAFREISSSLSDFSFSIGADDELTRIFDAGLLQNKEMSGQERARFSYLMNSFGHRMESSFVLYESGIIDSEQFVGVASICSIFFGLPGGKQWVEESINELKPSFLKFVRGGCLLREDT
jgi:hypothetical protein